MGTSESMRGNSLASFLLVALCSLSAPRAETLEAARTRMFREQYEAAGQAYNAKDYPAAIAALQAAYAIQPVPQLLFNIAQAHRKLDQYTSARTYFELYLSIEKDTTSDLCEIARKYIEETRERERAVVTPKVQVVEVEKTKLLYVESEKPLPRWLRPLGVVSGIAGLGLLVTGATFLGLDGRCTSPAVPPALACDDIYNTSTPGTALTAIGAGVFLFGVVTFGVSLRKPPRPAVRESLPTRPETPGLDVLQTLPQVAPTPGPTPAPKSGLGHDAEPPPQRPGTLRIGLTRTDASNVVADALLCSYAVDSAVDPGDPFRAA